MALRILYIADKLSIHLWQALEEYSSDIGFTYSSRSLCPNFSGVITEVTPLSRGVETYSALTNDDILPHCREPWSTVMDWNETIIWLLWMDAEEQQLYSAPSAPQQQVSGLPTYLAWWWRPRSSRKLLGNVSFCVFTSNPRESWKCVSVQISKSPQTVGAGGVHGLVCTHSCTSKAHGKMCTSTQVEMLLTRDTRAWKTSLWHKMPPPAPSSTWGQEMRRRLGRVPYGRLHIII